MSKKVKLEAELLEKDASLKELRRENEGLRSRKLT